MISPGVKRPPLIGSELGGLDPPMEGVRGGRVGVGAEDGLRDAGVEGGAMVSWSALSSLESIVAAVLGSSDPPHVEQNRPVGETCAPQEEQYMGGLDSIIAEWPAAVATDAITKMLTSN
ncbi:MAG: hypothetical protein ACREQC_01910 [Candidatus Binataceae bacterium]